MKTYVLLFAFACNSAAFAAPKKIDWSLCDREIKEFCAKITDDHEKHECLEKLPKDKVSDECREKNEKLEAQFQGKHGKGHKH